MLRRELCRASMPVFIQRVAPWFRIEEIHLVLASHYEAVLDGEIDRQMIFMPPRTGKPVADDQLVLRGDGQRVPLRDIVVGDTVITDKGRARLVQAVHIQGHLPTVEIRTRGGRALVAALDHPVLTTRSWVEAGQIRAGDVLGTPNGCADVAQTRRLHEFRLAGYFVGDGNVTTNGPSFNSNITCFDPVEAEDIRACAAAMGFTIGRSGVATRIPIGGGARDWLRRTGMAGVKAIHKPVPAFVFGGSNDEIANFIGAYFACDGSIFRKSKGREGWTIEFGSASHELLVGVQHLLMRLGIAANVTRRNGRDQKGRPYPSSRLTLSSTNEVAKFAARVPVHGVKTERLSQVGAISAFAAAYLPDPVLEVVDGGARPCRCLTVAEDGTFLASDLVVHNSQMGSVFMPSMYAGRYPSDKILQVGHSTELSRAFSLQVREIMTDPEYGLIYPGVQLAKGAKAAGRWQVENVYEKMAALEGKMLRVQRGQYNAVGRTSNIAGKGFNLGLPDDVMSEQDKDSKITKDRIWNWWGPGFYTRRQPERNAILLTMTRWAKDDLAGRLIELMNQRHHGTDVWNILNVPAILDGDTARKIYVTAKNMEDMGVIDEVRELKAGDSFAPRRWTLKELNRSKTQMTDRDWNALYMGSPIEDEGNLLKKRYWRLWPTDEPPVCDFVFQMYDTAFDEKTANDYSARTTWGVFRYRGPTDARPSQHMILLDSWRRRVDAPDLKYFVMAGAYGGELAIKMISDVARSIGHKPEIKPYLQGDGAIDPTDKFGMRPDAIIIENKASGIWLIKELRQVNKPKKLPLMPWSPPRGGRGKELGKYARAALGSEVLEQGAVWYMNRKWATTTIDLCAECRFDGSDDSDDLQDTVAAAMIYVRQSYRVEVQTDEDEEAEKRAGLKKNKGFKGYGAR